MRFVEMIWNEDEQKYEDEDDEAVASIDWKAYADDILKLVDEQLTPFGLEVFQYDHGGDYYMWRIDKRTSEIASLAAKQLIDARERASSAFIEMFAEIFLADDEQRQCWGREKAKRKAAARAAMQFLQVHLGDRFGDFVALLNEVDGHAKISHILCDPD